MQESVSEIFEAAAAKYLTAVDAAPNKTSNQHEIGGLIKAGLGDRLGRSYETVTYPTLYAYLPDGDSDDDMPPTIVESTASWYDARRDDADRSAEYRLYYDENEATAQIKAGDLLVVALKHDRSLAVIFTPQGSPAEIQLRHLFGLENLTDRMKAADMPEQAVLLPVRLLLEEMGINPFRAEDVDDDLDLLLERFPKGLPKTSVLSGLARDLTGIDARDDADRALLAWLDREELLFRAYEKHLVAQRLRDGFGKDGADVDAFVSFSLSVHNRRKSRVGHAFENHLAAVFDQHGLTFERGKGKLYTEGRQQPDFLFPSFAAYHDSEFPVERLTLLGAKTTCKDRWRQVLAEGDRLERKYLVTLEAGISERQTEQMTEKQLQLIVPSEIQQTYTEGQRSGIYSIADFIHDIRNRTET